MPFIPQSKHNPRVEPSGARGISSTSMSTSIHLRCRAGRTRWHICRLCRPHTCIDFVPISITPGTCSPRPLSPASHGPIALHSTRCAVAIGSLLLRCHILPNNKTHGMR